MVQLSSRALLAALRFIQGLHEVPTLARLRAMIPAAAPALIGCERANWNEVEFGTARRSIMPSPIPHWWARLGELYRLHMQEHPIWRVGIRRHQVVTFSDFRHEPDWRQSTLRHEYFMDIGVRHQMSVLSISRGAKRAALAFNRNGRDFADHERALLAALSPHVAQVYAAAQRLEESAQAQAAGTDVRSFVLEVRSDGRTLVDSTGQAAQLLRTYAADTGHQLGQEVTAWLRARCAWLRGRDLSAETRPEIVLHRAGGRLEVRLAGWRDGSQLLLLAEHPENPAGAARADYLTAREGEILRWVAEGKRDKEIGTILGISARTVAKHLENSFRKLAVETRISAVRQWQSQRAISDA